MEKKKKEKKSRELRVWVTPTEYEDLQKKFKTTTYRVFSDYIRDVLHQDPVVKKYRNQSLDDIFQALLDIKSGMDGALMNLTEANKRLCALPAGSQIRKEIEFLLAEEFQLKEEVGLINRTLIKIYDRCAREE